MSDIPRAIRAEIDQTPEWWDRKYRDLERNRIPRNAAYHEQHNIVEEWTYGGGLLYRTCTDCNVGIDPYEEGHASE